MSDLSFSCSHCGQHLSIEESSAGCQLKCPTCQGDIVIPQKPQAPRKKRVWVPWLASSIAVCMVAAAVGIWLFSAPTKTKRARLEANRAAERQRQEGQAIDSQIAAAIAQAQQGLGRTRRPAAIVAMYLDTEDPSDSLLQGQVIYKCYIDAGYSGIMQVPLRQAWTRVENVSPGRSNNRRIELDPGPPYEIVTRNVVLAEGGVANLGRIILQEVKAEGTARIFGTVKDSNGKAMPDVLVTGGTKQTRTDAAGGYLLDGFGLGFVSLTASSSGYFGGAARVSIRNMDKREIVQDLILFRPLHVKLKYVISSEKSDLVSGPGVEEGTLDVTVDEMQIDLSKTLYPSKYFNDFAAQTQLYLTLRTGKLTLANFHAPIFFREVAPGTAFQAIREVGEISFNSQSCPPLKKGSVLLVRGFEKRPGRGGVSDHCLKIMVEELVSDSPAQR